MKSNIDCSEQFVINLALQHAYPISIYFGCDKKWHIKDNSRTLTEILNDIYKFSSNRY